MTQLRRLAFRHSNTVFSVRARKIRSSVRRECPRSPGSAIGFVPFRSRSQAWSKTASCNASRMERPVASRNRISASRREQPSSDTTSATVAPRGPFRRMYSSVFVTTSPRTSPYESRRVDSLSTVRTTPPAPPPSPRPASDESTASRGGTRPAPHPRRRTDSRMTPPSRTRLANPQTPSAIQPPPASGNTPQPQFDFAPIGRSMPPGRPGDRLRLAV